MQDETLEEAMQQELARSVEFYESAVRTGDQQRIQEANEMAYQFIRAYTDDCADLARRYLKMYKILTKQEEQT